MSEILTKRDLMIRLKTILIAVLLGFSMTSHGKDVSLKLRTASLVFKTIDNHSYSSVYKRLQTIGRRCLNLSGKDVKKVSTRRGTRVRYFNIGTGAKKLSGGMEFYKVSDRSLEKRQLSNSQSNLVQAITSSRTQVGGILNRLNLAPLDQSAFAGTFDFGVRSAVQEFDDHLEEVSSFIIDKKYGSCAHKIKTVIGGELI